MDTRLEDRLKKWHAQIDVVTAADARFLELDASYKPFFAELFLKSEGKNITEREMKAHASDEWKAFAKGHAIAQSELNHARRLLDLKQKAYDAEHVTYKIEHEGIKRQ